MIARYAAIAVAAVGMALAAPQAQAESRFGFINKYIEKYAKVKDGDKIAGFDLNKITERLDTETSGNSSSRLSNLRNRISGKKAAKTAPLTAQRP